MFPFVALITSAGLFYLIVVSVTSDRELSLWSVGFWFAITLAAGFIAGLGTLWLGLPELPSDIIGIVISLGTLILILWHQGYSWKQVWTIILLYGIVRFGLFFVLIILELA